jgi:hypothetical protein
MTTTTTKARSSLAALITLALGLLVLILGVIVGTRPVHTDATYFGDVQSCGTNYSINSSQVATFETISTDPRVTALPFAQRALMDTNSELECYQNQRDALAWTSTGVGAVVTLVGLGWLVTSRRRLVASSPDRGGDTV